MPASRVAVTPHASWVAVTPHASWPAGFVIIVTLLLISNQQDFIGAFSNETAKLFGVTNAYAATTAAASRAGINARGSQRRRMRIIRQAVGASSGVAWSKSP